MAPIPEGYSSTVLNSEPNMALLLGSAVVTSFGRGGDELPERVVQRKGIDIDPAHVAKYATVCGFRFADTLPPTYLHMLSFPLSLVVMVDRSFPFAMPGLVHVANRIVCRRNVTVGDKVDVSVAAVDLRPHAKGQQFDMVASVSADGEIVWESVSTYLSRGKSDSDSKPAADGAAAAVAEIDLADLPLTAEWSIPSDMGRRYAEVSGDRNPIHLYALTAKAFGFPTAIAHGMWTAAKAIASLEGKLPKAFTYDVAFRQPVRLPSQVELVSTQRDEQWLLGIRGKRDGRPHLVASVRAA